MTRSTFTLSTTLAAIGLASSLAITTTAQADYPEQDIRLIIPYGPGGATDILFRLISQEAENARRVHRTRQYGRCWGNFGFTQRERC